MRRKTEQDYHDLAKSRGFEWLGSFPCLTGEKTKWKCSQDHMWETKYNKIQQGRGCPHCYGNIPKTDKEYQLLAQKRNLEYLGPNPGSVCKNTHWRCLDCNYVWFARHINVSRQNCPRCSGKLRITKQDYYDLAERSNILWIGIFPKTTHYKTTWKCKACDNEWNTTYKAIKRGSGCPACVYMINGCQASKIQLKIAKMLSLDDYVNFQFDDTRRRIDIAIPTKKIAIEYDSWYWHATKIEQDKERANDLIDLGWHVLSIKSREQIPDKTSLVSCLEQLKETDYVELVLSDWGKGDYKDMINGR